MNQKLSLHNPSAAGHRGMISAHGVPPRAKGVATTGRIVKLLVGHGHGFIRLADGRDVYFHRGDLSEGTRLHEFSVGDRVAFEVIEDRVSGARGLQVRRHTGR